MAISTGVVSHQGYTGAQRKNPRFLLALASFGQNTRSLSLHCLQVTFQIQVCHNCFFWLNYIHSILILSHSQTVMIHSTLAPSWIKFCEGPSFPSLQSPWYFYWTSPAVQLDSLLPVSLVFNPLVTLLPNWSSPFKPVVQKAGWFSHPHSSSCARPSLPIMGWWPGPWPTLGNIWRHVVTGG